MNASDDLEVGLFTLRCTVEGIIFRNEDSQYTVLEVCSQDHLLTVTGAMPEFSVGETVTFEGDFFDHPTYGKQFQAKSFSLSAPATRTAIERYLASGLIKGVGPSLARLIVQEFGDDTLKVLSETPEKLVSIPGIGKKRCILIAESFQSQMSTRQAMIFLQGHQITPLLAAKIIKKYGQNTEQMVLSNPFQLIDDIEGVGFLTADRIAQKLGMAKESQNRLEQGIKYILSEAAIQEGHTYLPHALLLDKAAFLLDVPKEALTVPLQSLIVGHKVAARYMGEEEILSLCMFANLEKDIANRLIQRLRTPARQMPEAFIQDRVAAFEKHHSIVFSEKQRDAIIAAVNHGLLVITGGPGTGKTTIINCILDILTERSEVFLAAPTGRAAKRMTEATGHEAKTLHRLLEYGGEDGQFFHDEENPLDCACLIVDEMSMVDVFLMRAMLRALTPDTRLILVGDAKQLPSVGPGNILGDMLFSGIIPVVQLDEIFRQDKTSDIILNAHRIQRDEEPVCNQENTDFFFHRSPSAAQAAQDIVSLCATRLPKYLKTDDIISSIQVLSPTKKGECGVDALNRLLQFTLNPPDGAEHEIHFGETVFRLHDKVIHRKNNYRLPWTTLDGEEGTGVFNGDIGIITMVNAQDKTLKVLYDDIREVVYEYKLLEDLDLAYCLSVHKSQGSEFPCVVMPVVGGPQMLLSRNLFYTGITRARRLLVLCGMWPCVTKMVHNDHESKRFTMLKEYLGQLHQIFFPEDYA